MALITTFARTACSRPVSSSRTRTPSSRPPFLDSATTGARFTSTAPRSAAVSASVTASRASSNCPSKYRTPPLSWSGSSVGMRSSTCARLSSWLFPNR